MHDYQHAVLSAIQAVAMSSAFVKLHRRDPGRLKDNKYSEGETKRSVLSTVSREV